MTKIKWYCPAEKLPKSFEDVKIKVGDAKEFNGYFVKIPVKEVSRGWVCYKMTKFDSFKVGEYIEVDKEGSNVMWRKR